MAFVLPPLPYDLDALEPHLSALTLGIHYKKHHKAYLDKLNTLVEGTHFAKWSLDQIILKTWSKLKSAKDRHIFNNASQVWNHTFYWNCMSSTHDQKPSRTLKSIIEQDFGSKADLIAEFNQQAQELFGSGWVWLVKNPDESLEIFSGSNAENPLVYGKIPLLVCDVWEHAYYLDYKNERKTYLQNFWHLVDWEFVETGLAKSTQFSVKKRYVGTNLKEIYSGSRR